MSLLYWWPLKTNYKGNTGKNLAVYAGTPVSRTDGKIDIGGAGRCYNIDLNFDNIVVNEGNFVFIDYEWLSGGVTSEFVLWRSLAVFYYYLNPGMQDMLSDVDLCGRFGITDDMIKGFKAKEAEFLSDVCDPYMQKYEKEVRLVNIAL